MSTATSAYTPLQIGNMRIAEDTVARPSPRSSSYDNSSGYTTPTAEPTRRKLVYVDSAAPSIKMERNTRDPAGSDADNRQTKRKRTILEPAPRIGLDTEGEQEYDAVYSRSDLDGTRCCRDVLFKKNNFFKSYLASTTLQEMAAQSAPLSSRLAQANEATAGACPASQSTEDLIADVRAGLSMNAMSLYRFTGGDTLQVTGPYITPAVMLRATRATDAHWRKVNALRAYLNGLAEMCELNLVEHSSEEDVVFSASAKKSNKPQIVID